MKVLFHPQAIFIRWLTPPTKCSRRDVDSQLHFHQWVTCVWFRFHRKLNTEKERKEFIWVNRNNRRTNVQSSCLETFEAFSVEGIMKWLEFMAAKKRFPANKRKKLILCLKRVCDLWLCSFYGCSGIKHWSSDWRITPGTFMLPRGKFGKIMKGVLIAWFITLTLASFHSNHEKFPSSTASFKPLKSSFLFLSCRLRYYSRNFFSVWLSSLEFINN